MECAYGAFSLEAIHNTYSQVILGDFGGVSPAYDTFDQCLADKDRVIANNSYVGISSPLGAICIEDELAPGRYAVELFNEL
jgi:hypothetical protein